MVGPCNPYTLGSKKWGMAKFLFLVLQYKMNKWRRADTDSWYYFETLDRYYWYRGISDTRYLLVLNGICISTTGIGGVRQLAVEPMGAKSIKRPLITIF